MAVKPPKESPVAAPDAPAPQGEPEVISEGGQFLLRITDPFITEFAGYYIADERTPAEPVTVTHAGVQVTKAQGSYLQLQAAQHGVATSLEKVSDDGGR